MSKRSEKVGQGRNSGAGPKNRTAPDGLKAASLLGNLVGRDGFEPSTNWLKASLSKSPQPAPRKAFSVSRAPLYFFAIAAQPSNGAVSVCKWDSFYRLRAVAIRQGGVEA